MAYVLRRLVATLPVMAVVAILVFLLIHLSPGDPAALIAGDLATAEDIAKLRVALGLDQPLWEQFVLWLGKLLTGDLGTSIFTHVPVSELLAQRLAPPVSMAAIPIATTVGVGIALLIGGVVVTETVFAIPGVGRLVIDSVQRHDYPVIQSVLLLSAGVYVLINLLIDLSYRLFDPRIRY